MTMYDMVSKDSEIFDPHNSTEVGLVLLFDLREYGYLDEGLLDEIL